MKGTIFVELINMAEDAFGEEVVDEVLDTADLENDGAYTTVGNYPCSELVKIITALSTHSGLSGEDLQRKFGQWMMAFFITNFPSFFDGKKDAFAMLESVDGEIHVEVKKLYPDAELPGFETRLISPGHLEMTYTSPRPLVAFCHGLIQACLDHFEEEADIRQCPVDGIDQATRFDIRLTP